MSLRNYGVLKGNPTHFRNSWQANNHYQIKIDTHGDFFRIAVNVRSSETPKDLFYKILDPFQHPIFDKLKPLGFGFNKLENKVNSGALDYIRGNLFDINSMQIIPDEQDGKNNDLNDLFDFYIKKAIAEQGVVYAFGERWFPAKPQDKYFKDIPDQGIHDIHMNQGNPEGNFKKDNGVWQDGGLLINYPTSDNWVGIFLRFQSQAIHTDDTTGHIIDGASPIVPTPTPTPTPTPKPSLPEVQTPISIVAALVNPKGIEEGNEKVLLFNSSDSQISLNNWSIANNMKLKHTINLNLNSGETAVVQLSKEVPLSNKGGIISLLNGNGIKIDGVSYTKEQAKREGQWIVF